MFGGQFDRMYYNFTCAHTSTQQFYFSVSTFESNSHGIQGSKFKDFFSAGLFVNTK